MLDAGTMPPVPALDRAVREGRALADACEAALSAHDRAGPGLARPGRLDRAALFGRAERCLAARSRVARLLPDPGGVGPAALAASDPTCLRLACLWRRLREAGMRSRDRSMPWEGED
ncbi:MAG: hypothetical protein AAGK21_03980 [Bacteroidota bacterium]